MSLPMSLRQARLLRSLARRKLLRQTVPQHLPAGYSLGHFLTILPISWPFSLILSPFLTLLKSFHFINYNDQKCQIECQVESSSEKSGWQFSKTSFQAPTPARGLNRVITTPWALRVSDKVGGKMKSFLSHFSTVKARFPN